MISNPWRLVDIKMCDIFSWRRCEVSRAIPIWNYTHMSHRATVKIRKDQFSRGMPQHRLRICCTAMFASEDAQMLVSLLSSGALQLVPPKCSCSQRPQVQRVHPSVPRCQVPKRSLEIALVDCHAPARASREKGLGPGFAVHCSPSLVHSMEPCNLETHGIAMIGIRFR